MVIAHLCNDDGGVGSVIVDLAKEQVLRGDTVYVVVPDVDKRFLRKLPRDVEVVVRKPRLPVMLVGLAAKKTYRMLKKRHPNEDVIIHAHNVATVGLLTPIAHVPLVTTVHGASVFRAPKNELSQRERIRNTSIRLILRRLSRKHAPIVCVSDATRCYFEVFAGIRTSVVHNGTSLRLHSNTRLRERDSFTLAHVGDMSTFKGWDKELQVFLGLRGKKPNSGVRFISAGRPTHFDEAFINEVRRSEKLDVGELEYYGLVDDIEEAVYKKADVVLLLSQSEGLSMALVESIAHGIPVLCSDVGGNPEVIVDGECGHVVKRDANIDMLVTILESMMDDNAWQRMSSNALQRYEQHFSAKAMYGGYHDVYREALMSK